MPGFAPTLVAVEFYRNVAGTNAGSTQKLQARPSNPYLTSTVAHGFYEMPVLMEATPDPTTGYGYMLLEATDDTGLVETPSWQVSLAGTIVTNRVTIPKAGVGGRTKTIGGNTYPAAWITELPAFVVSGGGSGGGGSVTLGDYYKKTEVDSLIGALPFRSQNVDTSNPAVGQVPTVAQVNGGVPSFTLQPIPAADLPEVATRTSADSTATNLLGKTTRYDTTSAAVSQTLPAATTGRVLAVGWDAGSNPLTLTAAGSDVIGSGSATTRPVSAPGELLVLHCTTAGRWRVTGGHLPTSFVTFNSQNTDTSGAATGAVPAVVGVDGQGKPTGYALTVPLNPFAAAIVFGG